MSAGAEWIYYFQEESLGEEVPFTGIVNIQGKEPSILGDTWDVILAHVALKNVYLTQLTGLLLADLFHYTQTFRKITEWRNMIATFVEVFRVVWVRLWKAKHIKELSVHILEGKKKPCLALPSKMCHIHPEGFQPDSLSLRTSL